jgi:hypothetical protein
MAVSLEVKAFIVKLLVLACGLGDWYASGSSGWLAVGCCCEGVTPSALRLLASVVALMRRGLTREMLETCAAAVCGLVPPDTGSKTLPAACAHLEALISLVWCGLLAAAAIVHGTVPLPVFFGSCSIRGELSPVLTLLLLRLMWLPPDKAPRFNGGTPCRYMQARTNISDSGLTAVGRTLQQNTAYSNFPVDVGTLWNLIHCSYCRWRCWHGCWCAVCCADG